MNYPIYKQFGRPSGLHNICFIVGPHNNIKKPTEPPKLRCGTKGRIEVVLCGPGGLIAVVLCGPEGLIDRNRGDTDAYVRCEVPHSLLLSASVAKVTDF